MTAFWNDVLHTFNKTSKLLQSVQIDLSTVIELYNSLVEIACVKCFKPMKMEPNVSFVDYYEIPKFENKQRKRKKNVDKSK